MSLPRELRAEMTNSKVPGPVPSQIPAIQYPLFPSFRGNRETEGGRGQEKVMGKWGCATKRSMRGKETPSKSVMLVRGREMTGREKAAKNNEENRGDFCTFVDGEAERGTVWRTGIVFRGEEQCSVEGDLGAVLHEPIECSIE